MEHLFVFYFCHKSVDLKRSNYQGTMAVDLEGLEHKRKQKRKEKKRKEK